MYLVFALIDGDWELIERCVTLNYYRMVEKHLNGQGYSTEWIGW